MRFSRVDLPTPLGPTIATRLSVSMPKFTFLKMDGPSP